MKIILSDWLGVNVCSVSFDMFLYLEGLCVFL